MMLTKLLNSKIIISLSLFLLALIPRLPDLDRFLTADEFLWVDRSRNFLAALTNPAFQCDSVVEKWGFVAEGLACTLRTGHPGVTTMWTGTFGFILRWLWQGQPVSLHEYVVAISTNPLDAGVIAWERLGTVLITSLWVVAVYWLVRRLLGPAIALVGAILIALDPFHIALSRVIHHDALSTTFMTLAVLCMFIYWGQQTDRRWLLLSGMLAGFGFLSKSPALYLMPFVALTGLWFAVKEIRRQQETAPPQFPPKGKRFIQVSLKILGRTILDGLLWFAVAAAIFVIFWPAMWVVPLETLETVFFIGSKYATGGHAKGNYFLGSISHDPGPLFYPITWLYRISPLVLPGLIALITASLLRKNRNNQSTSPTHSQFTIHNSQFIHYLPLILLFILGYYLLMTIGEKKQDRYFLPVYPWFNLIAAVGWLTFFAWLRQRFTFHALRFTLPVVVILALLVNGLLVSLNYPYYFTYYNPLLGGIRQAEKLLTIGWGEGLDLAADYLNKKSDAETTRVASWYQSTFAPYYEGTAISYSEEKGKVLAGDYAIFYINQTQRRFPDDILFEYFENRFEPEQTITLHGINYAWIYPSLGIDHYIQDQTYTGIASLLAWQWAAGDQPLTPGQPAEFELYWEYLGKELDEPFFFRLVDAQGRAWAEGQSRPVTAENPPVTQWRSGEIIVERGRLTPPPMMPPGRYELHIGFYTDAPAVTAGELLFTVPPDEALVAIGHADNSLPYDLPHTATPVDQPLTETLTLLGASWPGEPVVSGQLSVVSQTSKTESPISHPSNPPISQSPNLQSPNLPPPQSPNLLPIDLYWRVEQPLPADTHLHVGLMDTHGEAQQAWFNLSLAETFEPESVTWQPGDLLHTRWLLDILPDTPSGTYNLELVWPDDPARTVAFGPVVVGRE